MGGLVILTELGAAGMVFAAFVVIVVPVSLIGFAGFMLLQGIRIKPWNANAKRNIIVGIIFICLGILSYIFPALLVFILLIFLVIWPISSALVSLKRTRKGKIATPDGLKKRQAIAMTSILLAVLFFISPSGVAGLIIFVVASIMIFMGILFMLRAFGVRGAMKAFPLEDEQNEGLSEIGLNAS